MDNNFKDRASGIFMEKSKVTWKHSAYVSCDMHREPNNVFLTTKFQVL